MPLVPLPARSAGATLLLTPLLLLGCGQGTDEYGTSLELAEALDCVDSYTPLEADLASDVTGGTCTFTDLDSREAATLLVFPGHEAREAYVDEAVQEGKVFVVGQNWAVEVESEQAADIVQEDIGGESRVDQT